MENEYGTTTPEYADAPSNDDVISTLNNLIETCKDGQEGFQQAAEGVQNSQLKSLFYEFGQQRAQFAGELQGLVRELGGDDVHVVGCDRGLAVLAHAAAWFFVFIADVLGGRAGDDIAAGLGEDHFAACVFGAPRDHRARCRRRLQIGLARDSVRAFGREGAVTALLDRLALERRDLDVAFPAR